MKSAEAWERIFEKYNILQHIEENGVYKISADAIKEFREPRLMAKYDFSKTRPEIFRKHDLGILPITRGEYIIGKFQLYHKIKEVDKEPEVLTLPSYIETIDPDNIYSEANALHVGFLTGMLNNIVHEPLVQSISGRMSTRNFAFHINVLGSKIPATIEVNKPQIEIDGGYEGEHHVVLVEAKNKSTEDFIVRQLYYPYRYWKDKIDKSIVPVFFMYDSGIYTIYKYCFEDPDNYNSLKLIETKKYVVQYPTTKIKIIDMLKHVSIVEEPKDIPFPQADSITRIIDLLMYLEESNITAKEAAERIEYSSRQGNYYIDALRYLKLARKVHQGYYEITEFGKDILNMEIHERNITLLKSMIEHKVFYHTLTYYFDNEEQFPSKESIKYDILQNSTVIEKSKTEEKAMTTANRRASTVTGWLYWALHSQL